MWASHPGFPGLRCPPRADKDTIYKTTSGNPHQENVATAERGCETEGAGAGRGQPRSEGNRRLHASRRGAQTWQLGAPAHIPEGLTLDAHLA